jgi:hypothetical protein
MGDGRRGARRRWGVAATLVVLVVLGGCGGSSGGDAAPSGSASSTSTVGRAVAGPADLPDPRSFLLSTVSLPSGWTETLATAPTSGACNGPTDDAVAGDARRARAQFVGDAQVVQEAYSFRTPEAAAAFMDSVAAQVRSCPSWQVTANGTTQTLVPSSLELRQLGDQSFGYHVVVTAPDVEKPAVGDTVYVRKGSNVIVMFLGGEYSAPASLEQLAGAALAKLP